MTDLTDLKSVQQHGVGMPALSSSNTFTMHMQLSTSCSIQAVSLSFSSMQMLAVPWCNSQCKCPGIQFS